MRRCVFESLSMLSLTEKKARKVPFHPRATIIRGPNDTGKSCLMKTIYRTFSAVPPQLHPKWKEAEVRSLVRFKVGERSFAMLHNEGRFSVFDGAGQCLITSSSITNELSPFLADIFSFRLQLQSRSATRSSGSCVRDYVRVDSLSSIIGISSPETSSN
jgi:hypothetical protein